jgi:hypothetical protein
LRMRSYDSLLVNERSADPLSEESSAGLRAAMVQEPEETALLSTVIRVAVHLEVVERVCVEEHVRHIVEPLERGLGVQQRGGQLELLEVADHVGERENDPSRELRHRRRNLPAESSVLSGSLGIEVLDERGRVRVVEVRLDPFHPDPI